VLQEEAMINMPVISIKRLEHSILFIFTSRF
jgi:hypothetical protein